MKRVLVLIFAVIVWAALTAASPASEASAIAISGVAGVLLALLFKLVPAAGYYAVAITVVASFAIAVVAELLTGELVVAQLQHADPTALFSAFISAYGLSQFTFTALKQSPKTAAVVT